MTPSACPQADPPTAKQRAQLKATLKRASESLKAFELRLLVLHADESGSYRLLYPSLPLLADEYYRGVAKLVRSRESAAATGCSLSQAWLDNTAEQRARIDKLRNTRLKERSKNFSGPEVQPTSALRAGRKLSPAFLRSSDDPRVLAAEYLAGRREGIARMEQERLARQQARKERGRALREEFLRELAEADEARLALKNYGRI